MNRKSHVFIPIILIGFCMTLSLIVFVFSACSTRLHNSSPLVISSDYYPANYKQYATGVNMGVYNQNLYMDIDNTLYRLHEEGLVPIDRVDAIVNGICNTGLYYETFTDTYDSQLWFMNLSSGERTPLLTTKIVSDRDIYFSPNGTLFAPANDKKTAYYAVDGLDVTESNEHCDIFQLGDRTYMLQDGFNDNHVVDYDQSGQVHSLEEDIPWGYKSLIPCDQGLLVHNEEQGDLLYLIEKESGEVIELFTVECMTSISAVNVHGDYAYLSFKRYEKHGEIGMLSYKNDTLEGTYRISLIDYSAEKISDDIYNGLFIFDDTGIYACNIDTEIYKLDFDGNRIMKIEKH